MTGSISSENWRTIAEISSKKMLLNKKNTVVRENQGSTLCTAQLEPD